MSKKKLVWLFGVLGGIVLLLFLANLYVKNRLEEELDKALAESAYEDLSVNLLLNNFSIENVDVKKNRFAIKASKISAGGLSYFKYIFNNKLEIDELEITSPRLKLFLQDSSQKTQQQQKRELLIKEFVVNDGSFSKQANDTATASFYAHIPEAVVRNIKPGMTISEVNSYRVQLDTLYLKMNPEHYIDVGNVSAEDGRVDIRDFKIRSFFLRTEFDREIPYEKDWISLDVEKISLDSLAVKMQNDSLYLRNSKMSISNAFLNIYRNKLVKDFPGTKPLYSKMLRQAPFRLNFDEVEVENSEILYEERSRAEGEPAMVRFAAVNGEIRDLHNLQELSSQPKITANADFMRGTPINMEWTFPVFDPQDSFEISGSFGTLQGKALDPFLVPALNAQARGTLEEVFFNFYGNDDILRGDFRINYDNFKIELLTKEEREKKGFLSSIANLFVDNEQEPDEGGGQDVKVERVKNRSFWNFVWKGLREGLLDALGQI